MRRITPLFAVLLLLVAVAEAQVTASFTVAPPAAGAFCNPVPVYFQSTSTAPPGSLLHNWNFGVGTGVQSNLTNPDFYYFGSGTYTVTLIVKHSASGVSDTATQSITINNTPFPAFGMDDTTVCANAPVFFKDFSFLNGNVANYSWSFGDPASGANNTSSLQHPTHVYSTPGTYNVSMLVVTMQGCSATVSNQVFIEAASQLTVSNDTAVCASQSVALSAPGASSYSWSPGATLSNASTNNVVASPTASTTYTVSGVDAGGCSSSAQVVVNVITTGTANAGADQTMCEGTGVALQASGLLSYEWSPATGLDDPFSTNPFASPTVSTVYAVSGVDQNGCDVSDSVLVYVVPMPVADAGADLTVCENQSTYLQGYGGSSFAWTPSSDLLNANSFLALCNPTVTTTYTLTVSNGGTCVDTDEVVVTVQPNPVAVAQNTVVICPGASVALLATGGVSYQWFPAAGLTQNNIPDPVAEAGVATSYYVVASGGFGCTDTAQVNIHIKIPDDLLTQPGGSICFGEQIQLFASGMISYEWFPNVGLDNAFVPEPFCLPPHSITYKVKGFDGCYTDSAFVEVNVNNANAVDAGHDFQTFANNPVQFQATGNGTFEWYPSEGLSCTTCPNPTATVAQTTTYVVSNNNLDGCRTEDTVVVYVNCGESLLFVPNAFTPNNDGRNERFYVRTKGLKELDFFRVYTRTGQLVFETTNVDTGWDGTYKGRALPPGVFSYHAQATCAEDGKVEFQGNVTLIR